MKPLKYFGLIAVVIFIRFLEELDDFFHVENFLKFQSYKIITTKGYENF